MMNSNPTSKLVVGIGLAAVLGIGVSIFVVRAKHEGEVAKNAPPVTTPLGPAAAQPASEPAAPPDQNAAPQTPTTDPSATGALASTPIAPVAPAVSTATDDSKSVKKARTHKSDSDSSTRVASAASSSDRLKSDPAPAPAIVPAPAPSSNDTTSSATTGATAQTQETASTASTANSNEPAASDSQITTDVKSQIATAAPNGNVDVTTNDGVVSLAGSVPSQDNVDQAKQAAQRVAGVKRVDASALMVSIQ
jgi:hypothetical protein